MKKLVAAMVAFGAAIGPSRAEQEPPTLKLTPELNTPQAQELLRLFETLCVDKYPDGAAVAGELEHMGAEALSSDLVQKGLGGPGQGWRLQGANGSFIVTLKADPDRHCAVRTTADQLFAPAWPEFLNRLAATKKQELRGGIDFDDRHADGSVAHAFVTLNISAAPLENYTMIVEEYSINGRRLVETRLMRRVMPVPAGATH